MKKDYRVGRHEKCMKPIQVRPPPPWLRAPCGKSPQLYYLCASLLISDLIHIQPAMTRPPGLRGLRGSSGGGGGGGGSIGTRRRDGQASGFGLFTVCSSRALWGREAIVLACLFCTDTVKLHFVLPGDGGVV